MTEWVLYSSTRLGMTDQIDYLNDKFSVERGMCWRTNGQVDRREALANILHF